MLIDPRCWERGCRHFLGVIQPDGTELSERNYCRAFRQGIPDEIAYGDNLHLTPLAGQGNTVVYEQGEMTFEEDL